MTVEVCAECGFDGNAWTDLDAVSAIAGLPAAWSEAVDGLSRHDVQRRPLPAMRSIAEYVDHVREVLFGMRFLLETALSAPDTDLGKAPEPRFDPEPRVIDIDRALAALSAEANLLYDGFTALSPSVWSTTVVVDGRDLDVQWIARHAVHDPTHHLSDVARLRASL
jgi:hypothetical protein